MKESKPNIYIIIGLLLFSITTTLNRFLNLPEFFSGLGLGLGIALELVGLFTMNHELKLRNWKKNLLKKFIHKFKTNS